MPDFSVASTFNNQSAFKMVKFGANAPLLEVEVNELQELVFDRIRTSLLALIGDSLVGSTTISYSAGTFTLTGDKAIVNGVLLDLSTKALTLTGLVNGDTVYLDMWETDITTASSIKVEGNQQETNTITNNLQDSRIGAETSRRVQVQFNIVKANGVAGHSYLTLGTISAGVFTRTCNIVDKTASSVAYGYLSPSDKSKLDGISTQAKKVADSATNGNILIDGVETNVYTHPANHDDMYFTETELGSTTSGSSGAKKIGFPTMSGITGNDLETFLTNFKAYVDSLKEGLDPKDSVEVATTANITLSGTQTIDGIAVTVGDRVLVKNQTTGSQNGIYIVQSGAWTRATDANTSAKVTSGMYCWVEQGTSNADSAWVLTTDGTITLDTTSLTFIKWNGAGQITANGGLTKTGDTISIASSGVTDTHLGNRTIVDTVAPASNTDTLTDFLSGLAYMVKAITGKSTWTTAPSTTLESLNTHMTAKATTSTLGHVKIGSGLSVDVNGNVTTANALSSASTPNTIPVRDASSILFASYYHSSRGDETYPALSYLYDKGDGYMRKKSLANTQDEIVTTQAVRDALANATPPGVTAITGATSGAINLPNANLGASGYATALHMTTQLTSGYVQHLSFGDYRNGTSWGGGAFIGLGGADANPTENFLFNFGGEITHSSGKTFWNNVNSAVSKAGNGYQKLGSNGLILQWGAISAHFVNGTGSGSVTFPIAFPSAIGRVFGSICDANSVSLTDANVAFYSPSTTGVSFYVGDGQRGSTGDANVYWFAVGW